MSGADEDVAPEGQPDDGDEVDRVARFTELAQDADRPLDEFAELISLIRSAEVDEEPDPSEDTCQTSAASLGG